MDPALALTKGCQLAAAVAQYVLVRPLRTDAAVGAVVTGPAPALTPNHMQLRASDDRGHRGQVRSTQQDARVRTCRICSPSPPQIREANGSSADKSCSSPAVPQASVIPQAHTRSYGVLPGSQAWTNPSPPNSSGVVTHRRIECRREHKVWTDYTSRSIGGALHSRVKAGIAPDSPHAPP